jgi:hypothetical protein
MNMNSFFHGDNPTTFDYIVTYGTAVIGALLIVFTAANLTLLQQIILFLIALDILGGVVANVTRSTNVWYRQQSRRVGLIFIVLHIIQPVVLIALLDSGNWTYAIGIYVYMLISTLLVERLNPEQQKPTAYALTMLGILLFDFNSDNCCAGMVHPGVFAEINRGTCCESLPMTL